MGGGFTHKNSDTQYRPTGVSNFVFFFVLFQPGHLAIPEAYTRSPDLLPHRTDLTIQDVVRPFPLPSINLPLLCV